MSTAPPPRTGRRTRHAVVERVERLTPHLVRVVVAGPELDDFRAGEFTDHYVKLQIPPAGAGYSAPFDMEEIRASAPREQWPRTRTYTVRAWDPEANRLTIDFVVHGDTGVAGPWALRAQPEVSVTYRELAGGHQPVRPSLDDQEYAAIVRFLGGTADPPAPAGG